MSEEQSVPKALVLAARWAIQEVDDLFALNFDETVEDELSARVAHALYPAIAASQARLSEAVKVLEEIAEAGKSWNARQDMEAFFMISNSIESAKAFLATLGEENHGG